ncbi:MAG: DUF5698 domain-containing protein, partial [Chloroflexota bacterium]
FMDQIGIALLILVLRILNNAVSTIRIVFVARQRTLFAALLAFIESTIFAITVAYVVNDLTNPIMLGAYSGGFAIGSYVGMALERRLVRGFVTVNAVLSNGGHDLAVMLRDANYGVTETTGQGKEGAVSMLRMIVDRRDTNTLITLIREHQPQAFISVEEARTIRSGYIAAHGRRA